MPEREGIPRHRPGVKGPLLWASIARSNFDIQPDGERSLFRQSHQVRTDTAAIYQNTTEVLSPPASRIMARRRSWPARQTYEGSPRRAAFEEGLWSVKQISGFMKVGEYCNLRSLFFRGEGNPGQDGRTGARFSGQFQVAANITGAGLHVGQAVTER